MHMLATSPFCLFALLRPDYQQRPAKAMLDGGSGIGQYQWRHVVNGGPTSEQVRLADFKTAVTLGSSGVLPIILIVQNFEEAEANSWYNCAAMVAYHLVLNAW